MPTDANGVYSLPAGYLAITGQTIQASQHNPPLEDLAAAMNGRLLRNGAAPMTGQLRAVAGSAAAPGYTFDTFTNSGFFKTAAGIGVSIAGSQVLEFTASGLTAGSRFVGELIPWSGTSALPLTVFPVGQTLLRASYPALWAFAQIEIAAGQSFYNNGNGSTTFGIGDCRGRVLACKDTIFSTAGRLTAAGSGITDAVGAAGGAETITLTAAQLAAHSHANTLTDPGHSHTVSSIPQIAGLNNNNGGGGGTFAAMSSTLGTFNTNAVATGITINNVNAGGGGAHLNVQPTIVCTYLLFAGA